MGDHLDLGLGVSAAGAVESERATRSLIGTLKDYVSNLFGFRDATEEADNRFTSHVNNVSASEQIYEQVASKMRRLRNTLLAFAGVYATQDIFRRAIDEGKELEQLYTSLANRFGDPAFARQLTNWVVEQEARLPIAREELQSIIQTLDQFALPPQMIQLEGVLNAALGPAGDLNSAMSSIVSLAQSGDIVPFIEAFSGRITPQQINEALSGAVTIQERIIALTELLDQEFQGNIERQQRTVEGQMGLLRGIFDLFKEAFVGDPETAGTFFGEWRGFIQGFTSWFIERERDIIAFGRELGRFFGQVFRLFRQNFFALGDLADRMFNTLRRFIDNSRELVNPFILFLAIMIERVKTFFVGFQEGFVAFFQFLQRMISRVVEGINWMLEEIFGIELQNRLETLQDLLVVLFDEDLYRNAGRAVGFVVGGWLTFITLAAGIGKLSSMIKAVGSAMGFVFTMFTAHPYVATIVALTAAGVALWEAWEHNMFNFRDRARPILDWIHDSFEGVRQVAVGLWRGISTEVQDFWNTIQPQLQKLWNFIRPIGEFLGSELVQAIRIGGRAVWRVVNSTLILAFDLLSGTIKGAWEIFRGGIQTVLSLLTGDFPSAWEGFQRMISGAASMLENTFVSVVRFIRNLGGEVFDWFINGLNRFILGPIGRIGRRLGLNIGDLRIDTGGDDGSGRDGGRESRDIVFEPKFNQPQLAPAVADRSVRTREDNRTLNFTINQQPGQDAVEVARQVVQQLKREERWEEERKE